MHLYVYCRVYKHYFLFLSKIINLSLFEYKVNEHTSYNKKCLLLLKVIHNCALSFAFETMQWCLIHNVQLGTCLVFEI